MLSVVVSSPPTAVVYAVPAATTVVYVGETFRHHEGVTDLRNHMDWLEDELQTRTVADRLAMLERKEGERVPGGVLIAERPSQVELAGLVGASRETVARAMSELQRRGFVHKRGGGLLLLGGKDLEAELLG